MTVELGTTGELVRMVRVLEIRCQKCEHAWQPQMGHVALGTSYGEPLAPARRLHELAGTLKHGIRFGSHCASEREFLTPTSCGGELLFVTEPVEPE